jgi:type II secretory pathway pseudopilin PulG
MFVILIFSIIAAVCTSLYAKAFTFSRESREATQSVIIASDFAEQYKSGKDPDELNARYDKEWKESDSANTTYLATVEAESEHIAEVIVEKDGDQIYSIKVQRDIELTKAS